MARWLGAMKEHNRLILNFSEEIIISWLYKVFLLGGKLKFCASLTQGKCQYFSGALKCRPNSKIVEQNPLQIMSCAVNTC